MASTLEETTLSIIFSVETNLYLLSFKKKESQVLKRHTKFWSSIAHWNLLINPEFKGVNLDSFQVIQTLKRVWSVIAISAQWLKQNRFMLDISIVLTYKHHFKNTIGPYCDFGAKRNAKKATQYFSKWKYSIILTKIVVQFLLSSINKFCLYFYRILFVQNQSSIVSLLWLEGLTI